MDARELLLSVRDAYANFESYSDDGTVEAPDPKFPGLVIDFETHYVRPSKFRFQWRDWLPNWGMAEPVKKTAISNGENFRLLQCDSSQVCESFSLMVRGAIGMSSGSVHQILNMLVPGAIGSDFSWHNMSAARFLDDEMIGAAVCYHLIGSKKNADDTEAWIEKGSLLIRRVKRLTKPKLLEVPADTLTPTDIEMIISTQRKCGLADEIIEELIARLTGTFETSAYCLVYNYSSVKIDQAIDDSVFEIPR